MAIVRSSIWRGVAVVYLPSLPATMKPVIADVVDVTGGIESDYYFIAAWCYLAYFGSVVYHVAAIVVAECQERQSACNFLLVLRMYIRWVAEVDSCNHIGVG